MTNTWLEMLYPSERLTVAHQNIRVDIIDDPVRQVLNITRMVESFHYCGGILGWGVRPRWIEGLIKDDVVLVTLCIVGQGESQSFVNEYHLLTI